MKSLQQQFVDWVNTKPRDEAYNFFACGEGERGCAVTQFLALTNILSEPGDDQWCCLHIRVDDAVRSRPWTFGALADRLAAKEPS